jgi:hypothetical protein
MSVPPGTKAYLPFTVNAARVSETATNFLHQVNLSAALSNAYFKSLITTRANLLICNAAGLIMPSRMILDLTADTLFVYFDGPKSTVVNTLFYLCASPDFTQTDSTGAFINSEFFAYWGMDQSAFPVLDYANSSNLISGSFGTSVPGSFNKAITSIASTDILTSDTSLFANKTTFTYSVVFKPTGMASDHILFAYRTAAGIIGFQVYYTPSKINVYVGGVTTYGTANIILSVSTIYLITIVYDGSQATNANKLKLYINGIQLSLGYNGTIPATIPAITGALVGNGLEGAAIASPIGDIDEQGLSSIPRNQESILDRYRALFEPSTFYTQGSVIKVGSTKVRHHSIHTGVSVSI